MRTCRNHVRARYLMFCLLAGASIATIPGGAHESVTAGASPTEESSQPPVRIAHALDKLPISFEENRGQTDPLVRFISRAPNYTLFLTPTEAVLTLQNRPAAGEPGAAAIGRHPQPLQRSTLRMTLSGANPGSAIVGLDELPGKVNYARVDPEGRRHQAHENIPTYSRVFYRGIYPGIDLVYYGKEQSLEYDFILAPGASPGAIRLSFSGADALDVDRSGALVVSTSAGTLRLDKPVIYQDVDGSRKPVAGGYLVDGNTVSFKVGEYDRQRPLVIDPVLLYSSFLGGTGSESGGGVAVDAAGNIYLTGSTESLNFPSVNALQPANAGSFDGFVTKLNPAGTAVVYSTYFGGAASDTGRGIFVDPLGNAFVAGTLSVPTSLGLWQVEALVAKFTPTGGLVYSVAFGSVADDIGYAVAVDTAGYAYVTGMTGEASDFPTTPNALQPTWGGANDAFLSVLTPDGTSLAYSTYLGSGSSDEGRAIALDSLGAVYIAGGTQGGFPTTTGSFQRDLRGFGDAFVVKIDGDASGAPALVYSTLLGGEDFEIAHAIAVDPAGHAYVTGSTDSPLDFPVTATAFQSEGGGFNDCGTISPPTIRACKDAFMTKLNSTGSALMYSTYLGGQRHDFGNGIAVDSAGNAYVVGEAEGANFPLHRAIQPAKGSAGFTDAFVTKFNPSGGVVYSTYLGGAADDTAIAVALDGSDNAYVIGHTASANFPLVSPYQSTYGGNTDAFLLKIGDTADTCTYSIAPANQSFGASGGTGSITVTASAPGCNWSTTNTLSWVTITAGSGTGTGSATYSVTANAGASRSGTFAVAGQAFTVNQAGAPGSVGVPISANDAYATNVNTALIVPAPGVLANDNTNGGGGMTAALVSAVTSGTLVFNADGSFTYTPGVTFNGTDSFTYRATNGAGPGNVASVSIIVNTPTAPQPATALRVSSIVGNIVTFRWTPPAVGPAVTGYVIEGGISPGQVLASLPTASASPIFTVAVPTGAFYVRVHTLAGAARSGPSNEIVVYVNMPVAPTAPSVLVGLVNGNSVEFAWRNTFVGGAPSGLILDVGGSIAASVPLGLSETASFPVVPAGNYTFSLRATNASGTSAPSNAISLNVPSACSGAPLPPENFLAYKIGNIAHVVWDPAGTGAATTGYVLQVTGGLALTVPTNRRALSGAVPPGTYNLSVIGTNACGSSAPTPVETVIVP